MTRGRPVRRTPLQAAADRHAADLTRKLGRMLADGRARRGLTQAEAAARAGLSRGRWADMESTPDRGVTLTAASRAAAAVGGSLELYVRETSAADLPRDAVHLAAQELIIRTSSGGAWRALPEELIDREARTSRAADVLLWRRSSIDGIGELMLWDVWDWVGDVGASVRDFGRRSAALGRYAAGRPRDEDEPLPRAGACLVLRATRRNRELVANHRHFFRARLPGSGQAWLTALTQPLSPVPREAGLAWVSVDASRLHGARLG